MNLCKSIVEKLCNVIGFALVSSQLATTVCRRNKTVVEHIAAVNTIVVVTVVLWIQLKTAWGNVTRNIELTMKNFLLEVIFTLRAGPFSVFVKKQCIVLSGVRCFPNMAVFLFHLLLLLVYVKVSEGKLSSNPEVFWKITKPKKGPSQWSAWRGRGCFLRRSSIQSSPKTPVSNDLYHLTLSAMSKRKKDPFRCVSWDRNRRKSNHPKENTCNKSACHSNKAKLHMILPKVVEYFVAPGLKEKVNFWPWAQKRMFSWIDFFHWQTVKIFIWNVKPLGWTKIDWNRMGFEQRPIQFGTFFESCRIFSVWHRQL